MRLTIKATFLSARFVEVLTVSPNDVQAVQELPVGEIYLMATNAFSLAGFSIERYDETVWNFLAEGRPCALIRLIGTVYALWSAQESDHGRISYEYDGTVFTRRSLIRELMGLMPEKFT